MNSAKERARNVFPTPVGPRKMNDPDWATWIFQIGPGASQRLADGDHRLVLANDLLFELLLHFEEFLRFFLLHAVQRHPGPLGHDVHDIVARDDDFALIALFPPAV